MNYEVRKIQTLVLVILLCLVMCACGKSDAAQAADDLIMEIGTVTKHSEQHIVTAEAAVAKLTDREKKHLDNYTILTDARARYSQLLIDEVIKTIEDIGVVTLESDYAISSARKVYDNLDPTLQTRVSNSGKLAAAEEAYFQLKVDFVENAINAIGKVTYNSDAVINKARGAYESAEELVKSAVNNYGVLVSAEESLFTLKVDKVVSAIKDIGTVNLNSGSKITEARKAYNDATTDVRQKVINYSELLSAENTYSALRIENVEKLISEIGTVTLQSDSKINSAQIAFDMLSSHEKGSVKNHFDLIEAQKTLESLKAAEEEKKYNAAMQTINSRTDKIEGITWYESKQQPKYINDRCYVLPYIGQRGSYEWLCITYDYTGDDWIFFEDVMIWVDGETYTQSFDSYDIIRDNNSGDVWEYIDIVLEDYDVNEIDMLWAIAKSDEAIVRFKGDADRHDFTISSKDKKAIENILIAFEYMKAH